MTRIISVILVGAVALGIVSTLLYEQIQERRECESRLAQQNEEKEEMRERENRCWAEWTSCQQDLAQSQAENEVLRSQRDACLSQLSRAENAHRNCEQSLDAFIGICQQRIREEQARCAAAESRPPACESYTGCSPPQRTITAQVPGLEGWSPSSVLLSSLLVFALATYFLVATSGMRRRERRAS